MHKFWDRQLVRTCHGTLVKMKRWNLNDRLKPTSGILNTIYIFQITFQRNITQPSRTVHANHNHLHFVLLGWWGTSSILRSCAAFVATSGTGDAWSASACLASNKTLPCSPFIVCSMCISFHIKQIEKCDYKHFSVFGIIIPWLDTEW